MFLVGPRTLNVKMLVRRIGRDQIEFDRAWLSENNTEIWKFDTYTKDTPKYNYFLCKISRPYPQIKGCLPQILLGPFFNTLTQKY